jgi:hypothetical protein
VDHDQLFKAVLTAQLPPFLELFFREEAAQLDLAAARFVDKELFAAPPMGPEREVDLLVDIPLRAPAGATGAPAGALVAIQIEAQREPEFVWRDLEYFALLRRLRGVPVFPIALFPIVDVLGGGHGRRPRLGYERVVQREVVLGHTVLEFAFLAVTLRALDAAPYLAQPYALAGALAARMRPGAGTPPSQHKLACLRRIIEGSGAQRDETKKLLADVVETYLPLKGADADQYEQLLQLPENQGVGHTMKTWMEQQEEIAQARGEARGEARGAVREARTAVLRVLEARLGTLPPAVIARVQQMEDLAALEVLLTRAATATSLADAGLA